MNTFSYLLQQYQVLTDDITYLTLLPKAEPMEFFAGQYLEAQFSDNTYEPFSIANAPNKQHMLELHVRHLPTDKATNGFLENLRTQKQVNFRGPLGNAYYRKANKPTLFLAGGTGFAYCKAIIEQLLLDKEAHPIHLFWGVKTPTDFYLQDLPYQWQDEFANFKFTPVISQPKQYADWHGKKGYVHEAVVAEYPDLSSFRVYASGPAAMVHTALHLFTQQGLVAKEMISDML